GCCEPNCQPMREANPTRSARLLMMTEAKVMTEVIRVLLVDDQELIRVGFRLVLEAEEDIEVVGEAGDGAAAIAAVEQLEPDVVLMDVRMPGTDGIAATTAIARDAPESRVLVLTTFDLD